MVFMFQKEYEGFSKVLESKIKNSETIGVYFDSDADGCCAAALLTIYLLKKFKKYPKLVSCFHNVDEKLGSLDESLIFVLDTQPKKIDSEKIIILDHHIVQTTPKKSLLFNPTLYDKNSYIATSCIVYEILNNLIDMSESSWIASVGVRADKSEESCEDILGLTNEMYPEFRNVENRLIRLTSTSRNLPDASIVVNSLVECYNIGSPSFFGKTESSSKLLKIYKEVEIELENTLLKSEKLLESEKIVVYKINSKFNVQSLISSKLIISHPNKTIIVCNFGSNEKIVYVEIRSVQEGLFENFCIELKDLVEGIGGHKKAFGLSILKGRFSHLLDYLKNV